ncbi:CoA transferase [Paraburkholderia agricolaris]|uniref:CoA transferase n=1 Tax=Paraburkholderia agricolaris TaxID=2152888 RepID=UPI0038B70FBC
MTAQTLTGLRVVNFGLNLPGPMLARRLAKRGAQVQHIEPPAGDPTCSMFVNPFGVPLLYQWLHQHSATMRLDLKRSDDLAAARTICSAADVIIDGFLPGTLARLGIDPDELRRGDPGLVYCAVVGYHDRKRAAWPGHDLNFLATSGLATSLRLSPDRPLPLFPIGDIAGGVLHAETEILAALVGRAAHGAGACLTVGIADALADLDVVSRISEVVPEDPSAMFLSGVYACYRLYWAANQTMLALGALEEKFWIRFCHLIDKPQLAEHQFATRHDGADTHAVVEAALLLRDAANWERLSLNSPCCLTQVA